VIDPWIDVDLQHRAGLLDRSGANVQFLGSASNIKRRIRPLMV
jgi:hypothetical protein